jgi:hypothetical protein
MKVKKVEFSIVSVFDIIRSKKFKFFLCLHSLLYSNCWLMYFLFCIRTVLPGKHFCVRMAKNLYSYIQFSDFVLMSFLSQAREMNRVWFKGTLKDRQL